MFQVAFLKQISGEKVYFENQFVDRYAFQDLIHGTKFESADSAQKIMEKNDQLNDEAAQKMNLFK